MKSSPFIPMEEYLEASYRPDRDYVEGRLVERNVGERDHSLLQATLIAYLFARRAELGIHVFPEQRVQVKADRFRVPDLCIVAGPLPSEQIFRQPPFLCIEILSPRDRMAEMQERVDDYLKFGVRYVWVINPQTRHTLIYTSEGVNEARDGILRTENPHIAVNLNEILPSTAQNIP
ncbi:MAG: Uma2 family endonuclease [Bryobacteraceae bacterium]